MRNFLTQRRATSLRLRLTDSERALWRALRRRQIRGLRFRRQVPIGTYIVDFACLEILLVIEVDGGQHAKSEYDAVRDRYLAEQGFRVIRYWSNDVLKQTDAVVEAIWQETMPPS